MPLWLVQKPRLSILRLQIKFCFIPSGRRVRPCGRQKVLAVKKTHVARSGRIPSQNAQKPRIPGDPGTRVSEAAKSAQILIRKSGEIQWQIYSN